MHYNLVKSRNRAFLEDITNKAHEMPEVYECVNAIQDTAYKINVKILQVADRIFNNGGVVGKMPNRDKLPLPPKPFDIATNKVARRKYSNLARPIHEANATTDSQILLIDKLLEIAKEYEAYPEHYYPMQYDFRGRIYCKPLFLHYQQNDIARSLLLFTNGKPLGTDEALAKLAIHGANMYGKDKITLADRVKWVQQNEEAILASAKDPHNHYKFWSRCSEPYQFLAFCFEWEEFVSGGRDADFVTHLSCFSDCTNSGLQIFSALLRDDVGGKATNLTAEETPQDVYQEVADKTLEYLNKNPDSQIKKIWMDYGIDRATTKKVTMCVVYGLTQYSCRTYIVDHLKDMVGEGKPIPFSKNKEEFEKTGIPTIFSGTYYLSKLVWKAIGDVIISAKECMIWLQKVSRLISDNGLPVTFTTPTGFIVQMNYKEMKKQRVNTRMGESMLARKITIQHETDKIDKRKCANAISPCWIHSLDGSVLQRAITIASKKGIKSFATVHDSFGVLAPDVQLMNDCLRESFVDIFTKGNVLEDFLKEITLQVAKDKRHLIPELPKMRNLDITQVLKSDYFCS
jgi:DNA-directed RNA polymerase